MNGARARSLVIAMLLLSSPGQAETPVRIASYNIRFFSDRTFACGPIAVTDVRDQGDRLEKLRQVIEELGADILALQEINDRSALRLLFDPDQWWIVIDDDSGDCQDVALVVRRSLDLQGFPAADLDADDDDFLFAGSENNSFFPKRRDLLGVAVGIPGRSEPLFVLVHHAKSRSDGRATSEHRRVGAARAILQKLEHAFHERDFVLLGDFNDNPDDASLNILESGNPNAPGAPENTPGPFLINLFEPLGAGGHVSYGRKSNDIVGDRVNPIDPQSRQRNNDLRGTNGNSGDILFDQILIPPRLLPSYAADSARVFNGAVAVLGNNTTRASDHLPVFADFVFGAVGADVEGETVRITGLLPDPVGSDAGHEQVTLHNLTGGEVDLGGWKLMDRADNAFALFGTIPANATRTITMTAFTMPLTQSGDTVRLFQGDVERHRVSYDGSAVVAGQTITFE